MLSLEHRTQVEGLSIMSLRVRLGAKTVSRKLRQAALDEVMASEDAKGKGEQTFLNMLCIGCADCVLLSQVCSLD